MRLPRALAAAIAAASLAGLSLIALPVADVHAEDAPTFNDKFAVSVTRADGKLKIKFEGKTVAGDVWYMNREYPMNLKIAAGAATLGKAELTKDDATFEGTEEEKAKGKAKSASFSTPITGADKATVNYKVVVCSAKSCSPPIKGEAKEL